MIKTDYYSAQVDAKTGALISLKAKSSGNELLGGPANVVMAETVQGMPVAAEHFMLPRPKRRQLGSSSDHAAAVRVLRGPLTTQVLVSSPFHGGSRLERRIIFHQGYPRIDFETRLDLRADDVLVTVDFPLAGDVVERTRGIPYGFSVMDPRRPGGAGVDQRQPASGGAILPSVRWSNYQLASGSGLALLDRGLTGHELNGRTVTLALVNAVSAYMKRPNEMLRGQGVREYSYALVPHDGSWRKANIPRMAWEFNGPPLMTARAGAVKAQSFIETSANVIVEAVRRVDRQIELRLVETNGESGTAEVIVRLPHRRAWLTNMMGEKPQALVGGPAYRISVRPQQIVTMRFDAGSAVEAPKALRDWLPLVPPVKQGPSRCAFSKRDIRADRDLSPNFRFKRFSATL